MNELMVMAEIAGRRCALRAHDVQSVIELGELTPVPRTPDFIAGITALRSQALTVIDCRKALGIDPASFDTDSRAAVIKASGHPYALMVDKIEDITTAQSEPDQVVGGFGSEWSRVAAGMVETSIGPALLLNAEVLVAGPEPVG
ncbi:MAG: chemotaxis protein CheW, partial [Pseudomonadota bacterium]